MLSYFTGGDKQGPPDKEYSGFIGDCSPKQQEVLNQIKEWAAVNLEKEIIELMDDNDYLRFCRARNFVEDAIQKMIIDDIKWRLEVDPFKLSKSFQFTEYEESIKHFQ